METETLIQKSRCERFRDWIRKKTKENKNILIAIAIMLLWMIFLIIAAVIHSSI